MIDTSGIREHMEVVGSDGQHVGTVDHLDNGAIKFTKSDPAAGKQHHWLSLELVRAVEGDKVHLSLPAGEAHRQWIETHPGAEG